MGTIDKLNMQGIECIEALKRGEQLTSIQKSIFSIYTQLHGKKNNLSGKRITKINKQ